MKFAELEKNDLFIFKYEIDWSNLQAESGKYSDIISYVPILQKSSDTNYRLLDILVDNRRKGKGYKPIVKAGAAYSETEVYPVVMDYDNKVWRIVE